MKAIINIKNKRNQYFQYNGLTFKVKELLSNGVGLLNIDGVYSQNQTDFTFNEIIICDIINELYNARDKYYRISGYSVESTAVAKREFEALLKYCELKKINIPVLLSNLKMQ